MPRLGKTPRNRKGSQLAVELGHELVEKLRARAKTDKKPISWLVRQWIEAGLNGDLEPRSTDSPDPVALKALTLAQRLETELAQLRSFGIHQKVDPVSPKKLIEPKPIANTRILETDGYITTAELAEKTNTNRASWNNFAVRSSPGDIRHHKQAGSWRLVGKIASEKGGPDRWMWEPA